MQRRKTKTTAAAAPELAGKTIAVAETRELDVLAQLFEQRGATVIRCPLIAIFDAPDPTPIEAWLRRFVAGACDDLVLFTGEGLRRLLRFAERIELQDAFAKVLGRVRKITRGPKPVRVGLLFHNAASAGCRHYLRCRIDSRGLEGAQDGVATASA